MAVFEWQGLTKSGEQRSGQIDAQDNGQAMAHVRRMGLRNIKVKEKKEKTGLFGGTQKITDTDVVIFTRQMATMVSAGLPLVQCFELVARSAENTGVRAVTSRVKESIETGISLTEAMRKEPTMFDELFINLVAAGEQSGILETVLQRLAVYKEKSAALRAKVKSAMTYPISVLVIAFVITGILMVFVVPSFAELFAGFGAPLPMPTRVTIAISEWTQANWYYVIAFVFGAFYVTKTLYRKNENFHYQMDRLVLNLPVFGMILRKSAVARFARTFSTMVAAGTPILESLENVARTSGNRIIEEAVMNSRKAIAEGRTLTEPLAESGVFPSMVTQMIAIGESTGNLEVMLTKVADFYEEEVDRAVDNLTALLEPMILVILGTLIGGLVVAMYMPIFQMGQVVG
jgi:type IV pilus assembly protein PilC